MTRRRLGLFGGTFDPPHRGHVAAVRAAAASGRYDAIEVTVAGDPYRKSRHGSVLPAAARLEMARVAFADLPLVTVSEREIRRDGPSYTIDTVRELLDEYDEVDLIIGADLTEQIDSWRDAASLKSLVTLAVVPRPGSRTVIPEGWRGRVVEMDPVDLSSTYIREIPAHVVDLERFLPESVVPLYEGFRG